MNLDSLKKILGKEPKYRLQQTQKAIFKDLISDWNEVVVLPLYLRKKLNEQFPLAINGDIFCSKNKETIKTIITLDDGLKIEAVLMRHSKRNTICLSSQVGCPLGCKFCATGSMGFKRNLNTDEIIKQYLFLARYLKKNFNSNNKITNVVYMGMGEPFLNYENVLKSVKILNDKDLISLGARNISISTSGIIEGIKKLAKEKLQINLAISLHAPDDATRSQIMPINKKYPLKEILKSANDYIKKTSRKVMFEYLLLNGINDSSKHAEKLALLIKNPLYLVNLISYNPTGKFKPPSRENIKKFKNILEREKINVTQRYSFGQDIKAACGQLASQ